MFRKQKRLWYDVTSPMQVDLPDFALVVLIGASGSGKSTFAKTHFLPTEVLSSDYLHGVVCNVQEHAPKPLLEDWIGRASRAAREFCLIEGSLERPEEACAYFAKSGFDEIICQEKHMGSRVVVIVCRDEAVAQNRFAELREALTETELWQELETDWLILDSELLPWNAKVQGLLQQQYAPVEVAGPVRLSAARSLTEQATSREIAGCSALAQRLRERETRLAAYQAQLLAAEGRTLLEQDHLWHMQTLARPAVVSERVVATEFRTLPPSNPSQVKERGARWDKKTEAGTEGIVMKTRESIPVRNLMTSLRVCESAASPASVR